MKEIDEMRLVQIEASKIGVKLFRNNVAVGWVGKSERVTAPTVVKVYPGDVIIRKARPLHAGLCVGSSDLIGWKNGRFVAVEQKVKGGSPTS